MTSHEQEEQDEQRAASEELVEDAAAVMHEIGRAIEEIVETESEDD